MQADLKFGDVVVFDCEYRSTKPPTVQMNDENGRARPLEEVYAEMEECGYECVQDEEIQCKAVFPIKPRTGIFLGIFPIHTAFWYDGGNHRHDGVEFIVCGKGGYVDVAEIRCEGIKKSYYVPLDNIRGAKKARNNYDKGTMGRHN